MPILSRLTSLWRNLARKSTTDTELSAELQTYLDMLVDRNVASGMNAHEALRAARIEIGGIEQVKEEVRQVKAGFVLDTIWQDVRYGARSLLKVRTLAIAVLLSLALGIGLNTLIFAAIRAVLLRPLPYKEPGRLVHVSQTPTRTEVSPEPGGVPPANYRDLQAQSGSFEVMAAYDRFNTRHVISTPAGPVVAGGYHVSASFFPTLGIQPMLGRTFLLDEDKPEGEAVIITYRLWESLFQSDVGIIGRRVTVDGRSRIVIGVMPEEFRYYQASSFRSTTPDIELFLPYAFEHAHPSNRRFYLNSVIARLKPDISLQQAQNEMNVIADRLAHEYPKQNKGIGISVASLQFVPPATRASLLLALGVTVLVLLIACANVASLIFVRTEVRRREIAVRLAIGAGRSRIIRQLLTETFVLGAAGGLAGLVVVRTGSDLIALLIPEAQHVRRLAETRIDAAVLGFTVLVSLVTGLICGVFPAIRASGITLSSALKDSRRTGSSGKSGVRVQQALIVLQVALSMVLLTGAGLMIHSVWKILQVPLGFQPEQVLALETQLPARPPYVKDMGLRDVKRDSFNFIPWTLTERTKQFPDSVLEQLGSAPSVELAAVASGAPMLGFLSRSFRIDGSAMSAASGAQKMTAQLWHVTPNYFRLLGVPMLQGRTFKELETNAASSSVVINETLKNILWPGQASAVGEQIHVSLPHIQGFLDQPCVITGVVGSVRTSLRQDVAPQIYLPISHGADSVHVNRGVDGRLRFVILLRTSARDREAAIAAARSAIHEVEKDVPVDRARALDEIVSEARRPWQSTMMLLALAGGLALLLATVGIYGVISHVTARRTNEIGIRVAVGAHPRDVLWLVIKGGLRLMIAGIVLGLLLAHWLTRYLTSQLFGVSPADPIAITGALLMLLTAALAACYLPARHAAMMDPVSALRHQ